MSDFQMTPKQFKSIVVRLKNQPLPMGQKSIDIAAVVLLRGARPADVAREYEVSKQFVNKVINRFKQIAALTPEQEVEAGIRAVIHSAGVSPTLRSKVINALQQINMFK